MNSYAVKIEFIIIELFKQILLSVDKETREK